MMKNIILTALCFGFTAAFAQIPFKITGKVAPSHVNERVLLVYEMGKLDTTRVKADGTFEIVGTVKEPIKGFLRLGEVQPANNMPLFVAGDARVETQDSLKFAKVTGNIESVTFQAYNDWMEDAMNQRRALMAKWGALSAADKKGELGQSLNKQLEAASENLRKHAYQFVADHPKRYVSLYLLEEMAGPTVDYKINTEYLAKLDASVLSTPKGKAFKNKVLISKNRQVGTKAKMFTLATPEGKKLAMQEVVAKGKYTLVDFWASWCVPCRKENPNLLKAYNEYHPKGFEIVAISLDSKGENWKKAIVDDGLPWYQVSNLLGWKDPIAEWYGINAIPQNLLLDKDGNIVATNLRGAALEAKLSTLLK